MAFGYPGVAAQPRAVYTTPSAFELILFVKSSLRNPGLFTQRLRRLN